MKVLSVCLIYISLVLGLTLCVCWACKPPRVSSKVTSGEDTYVCLFLGPTNWTTEGEYMRIATRVKADELSRIKVPHSWTSKYYFNDSLLSSLSITDQLTPGVGLAVSVASMNKLSYQRIYRQVELQPQTHAPTTAPSRSPTANPSAAPTVSPTITPSAVPTAAPTVNPSMAPSVSPTPIPTANTGRRLLSEVSDEPDELTLLDEEEALFLAMAQSQAVTANNVTHSVTYPMLAVIIDVDKGNIQSVTWDNFCGWCDPSQCTANTIDFSDEPVNAKGLNCFVEDPTCQKYMDDGNITSSELCQLSVYIAWQGTDANGISLQSAASRFSRWSQTQISNFTSTLQDAVVL